MNARRIVAAALVAAVAAVGLVAQPAAAATQTASVVVAPDDGGVVRKGKDLGVTVLVTNTGTDALVAGRIASSLEQAPVASTTTLLDSIAHPVTTLQGLQGRLTRSTGSVPALAVGASATVHLTLKSDDISSIFTPASGARLLYVGYAAGGGPTITIAEASVVRIARGSDAKIGLGTLIPVLAPKGETGVVDTATQLGLTRPDGAWNDALRAAEASPSSTIALDPAVIASIRLAGDSAPPEAKQFLDELSRLPNETIRLPYADRDVTLERAAGSTGDLDPSSFAGVTLPAVSTDGPTPTPAATPAADAASPSASDLTAWNWSEQTVAWPVPHTTNAGALAALGRSGAVLLPSDDVADTPARRAAGPAATVGGTTVLVADASASSLLAASAADGPRGDAALATLTGLLATAAVTGEATSVLATTGRATDAARLGRALSTLGGQSWIDGRSLSQLATGTATSVGLRSGSIASARVGIAKSLLAGEHEVQELGTAVTADRDTVTAPPRLALLGMLSASWRSDDTGWRGAADSVERGFTTVVKKVRLPDQSPPNFIGSDGKLLAYVDNGLGVPVKVVIHASASNGAVQFTGDGKVTVTVPAHARARGELSVRTIRNGSTDITLLLTTPGGTEIGTLISPGATVRAGFDTLIAVALLTALGLLLALGVYRNVKRRKQPRAATA